MKCKCGKGYASAELYWTTNLILADQFARVYGLNRAAAIQRCARKMRDARVYHTVARRILKSPNSEIVGMVEKLHKGLIAEGVLK